MVPEHDNHCPPSCPPITFSSDPGEGKVAGNNTERERVCREGGKWEEQSTKSFRGQYRVQETEREGGKKKKEGGRSGRSQPNWSHHAWHANDERPHGPPHSLTFPHCGSQQTSWALHTSWKTHTHYFPLILYKPTVATPGLMLFSALYCLYCLLLTAQAPLLKH